MTMMRRAIGPSLQSSGSGSSEKTDKMVTNERMAVEEAGMVSSYYVNVLNMCLVEDAVEWVDSNDYIIYYRPGESFRTEQGYFPSSF